MKKLYKVPVFCAAALTLFALAGCGMELSEEGPQADGIIIYSRKEILNDSIRAKDKDGKLIPVDIVAKREERLTAVSVNGGKVKWESDTPSIVDMVDQTGLIRVGQALGRTATITASLVENPSIRAQVTFLVKDLR